MAKNQRGGYFSNHEFNINLNQRISKKLAYIIIFAVMVLVLGLGYIAGELLFWSPVSNYFEYRIKQINQDSGNSRSLVDLAMAVYLKGDILAAENILRDVLAKQPKNSSASLYLGLILSDQKKYNEAIPLLESITKQIQGSEARLVYLYLGQDFLAVGKPKLAVQYLGYAEVVDPGNPVVYYSLGLAYEKMNDTPKAVVNYKKAIKLSPNYVEAEAALKNLIAQAGANKASTTNIFK